jgi:hypothetical protein
MAAMPMAIAGICQMKIPIIDDREDAGQDRRLCTCAGRREHPRMDARQEQPPSRAMQTSYDDFAPRDVKKILINGENWVKLQKTAGRNGLNGRAVPVRTARRRQSYPSSHEERSIQRRPGFQIDLMADYRPQLGFKNLRKESVYGRV